MTVMISRVWLPTRTKFPTDNVSPDGNALDNFNLVGDEIATCPVCDKKILLVKSRSSQSIARISPDVPCSSKSFFP